MSYRYDELTTGEIYHVFTRGVEKRKTFITNSDYQRFLDLMIYCLPHTPQIRFSKRDRNHQLTITEPETGLVDIYCYCPMPNHLHLILRQNCDKGIPTYMKRLLTGYSCYFNTKYDRSGSLFIHPYRAILINDDDQFIHTTRYVHINPYVAHLIKNAFDYPWSSLNYYVKPTRRSKQKRCHTRYLSNLFTPQEYRDFVTDYADYSRTLKDEANNKLFIDIED